MLFVKGTRVRLVLVSGRTISCSGGMMHDPNGKSWPRCSVLVGPFQRGTEPYSDLGTRQYYGAGYEAKKGRAIIPDERALSAWKKVGEATRIYYVRAGNIYGGQLFKHDFKKPCAVYKLGRFTRLELGGFCNLGPRGFVSP